MGEGAEEGLEISNNEPKNIECRSVFTSTFNIGYSLFFTTLQPGIIKHQITKRLHPHIQPAVIDVKIGCMMRRGFFPVGCFGHTAEVNKKGRRFFAKKR